MDMILVGDFGLSYEQSKTQMAVWSILASPLLMSNDLRNISSEMKAILQNTEVIAVNQDPLGVQGLRVSRSGDAEIWKRDLVNNEVSVVLFNRGNATPIIISFQFSQVGFRDAQAKVRDLYAHADLGVFNNAFSTRVNGNGVVMLRLSAV